MPPTRRTAGTPTTNPNNKGPGKPQQTNGNNKAPQRRPGTAARSADKDRPASALALPNHKKTSGRPHPKRVHAAPTVMDQDESDVDVPATASQDHDPPAATHARRQAQAPNKSISARQSVPASHRAVPDDEEEEEVEGDQTDQEDEDEDEDIYGGVDGAVGDALGNELAHFDNDLPDLCRQQSVSSLGLDELHPSSEGVDDEDKLEDDEGEAEAPLKKKSRKDLRREEIPTWKEASELGNSGEDEIVVLETSPAAGQKRKYYRDSGPRILSVSKEFPDASYRRPAAGQTLGITDQPDKLRTVLSCTVRQVIRHAISKTTYIEMTKTHSTLCKIFMHTARCLDQGAYADRIKVDVVFQKDMAGMLSNRLSGFRSNIKNAVTVGLVKGWYHLDGPDMKTKAADLIKQEKYIFPSSNTGPDFVNKAKPFLHAAIVSILQDGFFTADRGACLVSKHPDCFKSSKPERPEELEVTAPMAAFAATCIHATLMQICSDVNSGHHRRQAFNTDQYEGVYKIHIEYLNTIRSKSMPKYHRLMADLYKAASSGTQVDRSDLGQASIDIDGMSE